MTSITRLLIFPQQDKYTSIPDALTTKQNGFDKNFYTRIHCKANAVSRALKMNVQKTIKLPLFLLIIEPNGILWILVFANWCANRPIYPTISEDDYEYILNHSAQSTVLYRCRNFGR
jgi:long-chain acyl-CoA synthetase